MKIKKYEQLKETVITETLDNGLKITMVPKNDYHKTFAVLTTPFGSLHQHFSIDDGKLIDIPAGTAHFLEHKLFEKEDGDAFSRFGELGADANAFTNQYQTSYLFSSTSNFKPALIHLLDFVQTPYFTNETVAKEQGIIGQEIKMYEDDVNWIVYMGLLQTLYPNSAISYDIAGTQDSIAKITPELLYQIHQAFYQPSQLTLQIVGAFDPQETLAIIKSNQKHKTINSCQVNVIQNTLPETQMKTKIQHFDVSRPKIALGIRLPDNHITGKEATKIGLVADILLDMMFGEHTDWYQKLYNKGIIDTEFETSFDMMYPYQFISFFSETTEYETLTTEIYKHITNYKEVLSNQELTFNALKRATLGEGIQRLNSLESIALRGDDILFGNNLFDKIMLLQKITYNDVLDLSEIVYKNFELQRFILKK